MALPRCCLAICVGEGLVLGLAAGRCKRGARCAPELQGWLGGLVGIGRGGVEWPTLR